MNPINPIIEQAETLSLRFYTDDEYNDDSIDTVLTKSW